MTDADLVALAVLWQGPAHGHGIWSRLAEHDVEDWAAVSRAQVYYSLGKLADQGLIRPAREGDSADGRERQTWSITAQGRRAMKTALASGHWAEQRIVPPFMTWAALASLATPATRKKIVAERRAFLASEIERERVTFAEIRRQPQDIEGVAVAGTMVGHVIRQMTLELEWLDELEVVLAESG